MPHSACQVLRSSLRGYRISQEANPNQKEVKLSWKIHKQFGSCGLNNISQSRTTHTSDLTLLRFLFRQMN